MGALVGRHLLQEGRLLRAVGDLVAGRLVVEGRLQVLEGESVVEDADVAAHIPAMPPDRVLEAWVRRADKFEAVPTLFVPDGEGEASTRPADLRDVDLVMVTAEPPGASKAPTSAPLVSVPIG